MTRHPLRWNNLIFGLLFLLVVGHWAVWKQDLLSARELSLTASGVLIALGLIGIAATFWGTRPTHTSTTNIPEGINHEEIDPHA